MRGRPPASLAFGIALCSGYNALQIAGYKYDSPVIRSNPNCPPHHDKHPPIVTPINNGNNGERRMLVDRTSAKSRANAQNILGQGLSLRRSLLSRGGGEKKRGGVFGILQRGAKMLDSTLLNNEVKLAPAPVESKRKSKEALQRAIVSNMLLWAAVVGFTLAFQRWPSSLLLPSATSVEQQASAKDEVHTALVWTVVTTTTLQVFSNVLRLIQVQIRYKGFYDGAVEKQNMQQQQQRQQEQIPTGMSKFRYSYLAAYAVHTMAESLTVPYLWKYYQEDRNLSNDQIMHLWLGSILSSLVTGSFCGGFVDRCGRRMACVLSAIFNATFCLLTKSMRLQVLMLGRIFQGASLALAALCFESWVVTEHNRRGYPSQVLPGMFRLVAWTTNLSIMTSGFVSERVVDKDKKDGYLAAVNISMGFSVIAGLLMWQCWPENYGDRISSVSRLTNQALKRIASDDKLALMAVVQVLFEGPMLVWLLMWSPCLEQEGKKLAVGTVLSTLLISSCGGTALFKVLTEGLPRSLAFSSESCLLLATGLSTVLLGIAAKNPSDRIVMLRLFLLYEVCIGIYSPAMATSRSTYITDDLRSTVMGILRVPTMVLSALIIAFGVMAPKDPSFSNDDAMAHKTAFIFSMLAFLVGLATLAQTLFTLSIVGVKRHAARVEEIITSGGGRRKDGGSGKRAGDSNVDGPSPASMFGRMFKGDSAGRAEHEGQGKGEEYDRLKGATWPVSSPWSTYSVITRTKLALNPTPDGRGVVIEESGEGVDSTIAAVAAVAAVAKYSGPSEASSVKAKKSLSKSKPSQGEGYSKRTCSVNKNNYTNSNMARKCVNGQVESKAETTPSGVRVVTSRNAQARAVNVVRSRTPQACSTCSSNDAVSKTNTNGENSIQADKPATHATHGEVLRRGKLTALVSSVAGVAAMGWLLYRANCMYTSNQLEPKDDE